MNWLWQLAWFLIKLSLKVAILLLLLVVVVSVLKSCEESGSMAVR